MIDEEIGVAELTDEELRPLEEKHPELAGAEAALVITGPEKVVSFVRAQIAILSHEAEQRRELFDVLIGYVGGGVLPEPQLLQLQRQAKAREDFLAEFRTLSSDQVARLSGSAAANTAAQASRWKRARKALAVSTGQRDLYPAFQFGEDGRPLPLIARLLEIFEGWSPWGIALWLASNTDWLGGRRPVDLLRSEPEAVLEAARRAVEPLDF